MRYIFALLALLFVALSFNIDWKVRPYVGWMIILFAVVCILLSVAYFYIEKEERDEERKNYEEGLEMPDSSAPKA